MEKPVTFNYMRYIHQYEKRKAAIQRRMNERCSQCAWAKQRLIFWSCDLMNDEIRPYWHMACFKAKGEQHGT